MLPSNLYDPACMTPPQRRTEAAALLALGLYRLRGGGADDGAVRTPSPVGLGFDATQRVHADSTNWSPRA